VLKKDGSQHKSSKPAPKNTLFGGLPRKIKPGQGNYRPEGKDEEKLWKSGENFLKQRSHSLEA